MQKETNQGHKNKVSCLKQGNKMSNFCLKLSQEISRRWWHKATQTTLDCTPRGRNRLSENYEL